MSLKKNTLKIGIVMVVVYFEDCLVVGCQKGIEDLINCQDPKSRISVNGSLMYLLGIPICWRSKAHKGVTLFSNEAECVAMSEVVKEIRFIFYLLTSMFIKVKLPTIVRCDNVGAIFMAENLRSGVCTRHADTRCHFVREHIVDDFI